MKLQYNINFKNKVKKTSLTTLFALWSLFLFAQNEPALIPYPAHIELKEGQFALSGKTQLVVNDQGRFVNEVYYLQNLLKPLTGNYLSAEPSENCIEINYSSLFTHNEGYKLDITNNKIKITAKTTTGLFYALQTLRQLLPIEVEIHQKMNTPVYLPALTITDYPAFEWRGSLIDVSRHFYSIEYLKKHIDRLAYYKMNKLHLHLADDQGWRIEIKKYPELTMQGAWRNYDNHDSICMRQSANNPDFIINPRFIIRKEGQNDIYGGYYTQEQIKDLIQYAASRHIEIIPEIDMPGHSTVVIANYPHLSCTGKTGWGKQFSVPLCVCNEEVYTFVENVLSEIIELFPSQYIHIGADEVDKTTWRESEICKELMERESIKNVEELQSYFVHRVQNFVESKGKQIIGWDEVLEGGIDSNVTVMYWRSWIPSVPEKATKNGNKVIMCPVNPFYFDYSPNKSTLYNVYNVNIIPRDMPEERANLIKGAQANLWAEKIPSENRADFLMFPRMTALAERVWTNKELYESYMQRILRHYPRLEVLGIRYRLPDIQGFAQESVFIKEALFDVKSPLPEMKIHYTTDGSIPNFNSPILNLPLKINKPQEVKFALFSPSGIRGDVYAVNYTESKMHKAVKVNVSKQGLNCEFYNQRIDMASKITGKPDTLLETSHITVPKSINAPSFGLVFKGYIHVPETGIYNFYLTCDDAGMLYIHNSLIINNEGPHSPVEKSGQVALEKGLHPIKVDFVEGGGGYTLRLEYTFNGSKQKAVPESWFKIL